MFCAWPLIYLMGFVKGWLIGILSTTTQKKLGTSLVLVMLVLEPRCGGKLASGGVMEAL